jgi:hypothetical protein
MTEEAQGSITLGSVHQLLDMISPLPAFLLKSSLIFECGKTERWLKLTTPVTVESFQHFGVLFIGKITSPLELLGSKAFIP